MSLSCLKNSTSVILSIDFRRENQFLLKNLNIFFLSLLFSNLDVNSNSSMKESLLDYTKYILEKVSFDIELSKKEYKKSLKILKAEEISQLNNWIKRKGLNIQPIYLKK